MSLAQQNSPAALAAGEKEILFGPRQKSSRFICTSRRFSPFPFDYTREELIRRR
jgi:hypothetical protein